MYVCMYACVHACMYAWTIITMVVVEAPTVSNSHDVMTEQKLRGGSPEN